MKYDYFKANQHLKDLRRKIIEFKDGVGVEGITPLETEKDKKKTHLKSAKTQELS